MNALAGLTLLIEGFEVTVRAELPEYAGRATMFSMSAVPDGLLITISTPALPAVVVAPMMAVASDVDTTVQV